MIHSTDDIGLDLEEARARIDAVRERLQTAIDAGADDEAARRLLARPERLSAGVKRVEGVAADQSVGHR